MRAHGSLGKFRPPHPFLSIFEIAAAWEEKREQLLRRSDGYRETEPPVQRRFVPAGAKPLPNILGHVEASSRQHRKEAFDLALHLTLCLTLPANGRNAFITLSL